VVHDELLAKVGLALRRAAKRAGEIVAQTNTPIARTEKGSDLVFRHDCDGVAS